MFQVFKVVRQEGRGNFENFENVGATSISACFKIWPFDPAPIAGEALPQVSPWAVQVRDGRTSRPIGKLFETKICLNKHLQCNHFDCASVEHPLRQQSRPPT